MTLNTRIAFLVFSLTLATVMPMQAAAQPGVQSQSETNTPLQEQAEELAVSASTVTYEFVKQVYGNISMSEAAWRRQSAEYRTTTALQAYYLAAVRRATLLTRADPDLADIINEINSDASNSEPVAKTFEQSYYTKFGVWPPIVPVDVDSLIGRMLDASTIR